ncbi:MAG: Spy/CpxP family protein refolding chaperone [Azospirillaceae bacterium]|nr:Spy/CpxP family protein refolding chaperone [Azospirillaceae bacterium]
MLTESLAAATAVLLLSTAVAFGQPATPDPHPATVVPATPALVTPVEAPSRRRQLDPIEAHKRRCADQLIVQSRRLANLELALEPTPAVRPLWQAWHDAVMASAEALRNNCLGDAPRPEGRAPTALERQETLESQLAEKLKLLQNQRPALEALYAALNPPQRRIFDAGPFDRHHAPGHDTHRRPPVHGAEPRQSRPVQ